MVSSRAFSHRLTCSHCHGLSHSQSFNNLPHSCTPLLSKGLLKRWFVSSGCYCHIQALIAKRGTENLIIVSDSHPCLFFLYLALLSLSSQVCVTRWRAGWLFPTSSRTTTRCTVCRVAPSISLLSRPLTKREAGAANRGLWRPTVSTRRWKPTLDIGLTLTENSRVNTHTEVAYWIFQLPPPRWQIWNSINWK